MYPTLDTDVSTDIILTPGIHAVLKKFNGHLITLAYVIYSLVMYIPIYIT